MHAFELFLFSFQFKLSTTGNRLVFGMACDDKEGVAAGSAHEEGGIASATSRLVVRETVHHWDVAEYARFYPNTPDERHIGAMFTDGRHSMVFVCLEARRDTDIGVWNRGWTSAGERCASIMDQVGRFNMLFVRHAVGATYVRALLWILYGTKDDCAAMGK